MAYHFDLFASHAEDAEPIGKADISHRLWMQMVDGRHEFNLMEPRRPLCDPTGEIAVAETVQIVRVRARPLWRGGQPMNRFRLFVLQKFQADVIARPGYWRG